MRTSISIAMLISGLLVAINLPAAAEKESRAETAPIPERTMNVKQGPESVFKTDVAEILPSLKGAVATRKNGRVGNELVFWGYRLANGNPVYLYACAQLEGVDCVRRRQAICPVNTQVLTQADQSGKISHFRCKAICPAHNGEVLPCCQETMEENNLMVGLVKCR